ncbi:hypothetical protein T09_10773 [Trichinella sp. T9]|nr:hypothetical protein T09_10773 [Trichinella sp. T9]
MSLEIENNQKPPVELARRWLAHMHLSNETTTTLFINFSRSDVRIENEVHKSMSSTKTRSVGMKGTARFDKDSALLTPLPICSGEVMCLKERNGVTACLWIESKNHVLMILVAAKTQVAPVKRLIILQLEKGLVVVDTATCWCDSQMATLRSKSSSSTFLCNGHRYRHYDRLRAFGRKSRILKEPRVLEKRSLERNHEGYPSRISYNNSHDGENR